MLNETIVRELSEKLKEPKWLLDRRINAFKKFAELEMPSFKEFDKLLVKTREFARKNKLKEEDVGQAVKKSR